MISKQTFFNETLFHVGIVKNTDTDFHLKVGQTEELCRTSKTLCFKKHYGINFRDDYKSLGYFQSQIIDALSTNNYENFGTIDNPVNEIRLFEYRFNAFAPKIPITRL